MNSTCIIFGIAFILGGALFAFTNLYSRMEGWQRMSKEEQAAIKIRPLCMNLGAMISLAGFIFLAAGVSAAFKGYFFIWAMIVWLIASALDVWYIEKSDRYKVTDHLPM